MFYELNKEIDFIMETKRHRYAEDYKSNNELEKEIKRDIKYFYEEIVPMRWSSHMIHLIFFEYTMDDIFVNIITGRPGLIIGKGGKDIEKLKSFLQQRDSRIVDIYLHEFDVWND